MPIRLTKPLSIVALSVALLPAAHADDNPLWSLAIAVPGLAANVGNIVPMVPQPVYVAPPVQYVPVPGYYAPPPGYGRPGERRGWRRHEDERRHEDDGGDH